jgi:ribosomal protein L7/L12
MKMTASLWIDHRKAVIVIVSAEKEKTFEIKSNVEKQPGRFAGVRSTIHYEAQLVQADDSHERNFTNHLNRYYAKVIAAIRDVKSIQIFGPGEAKEELKKHLEYARLGQDIIMIETADKMTNRQVAAKARKYFHKYHSPQLPKKVAIRDSKRKRTNATNVTH